jgi:hypothetical protein
MKVINTIWKTSFLGDRTGTRETEPNHAVSSIALNGIQHIST